MPTYGYECLGCSRSFETVQKITEDALTQCDVCGGVLKKKVFPVGVVFKGSGFYVNDYAKKGGASEAKTDSASDSKTPEPSIAPAATESTASEVKPSESKTTDSTPAAPAPTVATK